MSSTASQTTMPTPDIIDAARAAVEVSQRITTIAIDGDDVPVRVVQNGNSITVEVAKDVIAESERRGRGPIRRSGTVELGSVDSLIAYVDRFKVAESNAVAFAPVSPPGITVIFDYHPATDDGEAAWCQDRASYKCPLSRQWQLWLAAEGKAFAQVAFGDFIEANQADLSTRDGFAPATQMIEVARNLVINVGSKFARTVNPTTGEGTLIVKDEHDASTSTRIPKAFALAIPVFEGDEVLYPVEALLRFAMVEGRPTFAFVLQNKEKCLEFALAELRKRVASQCGIPVFVGTPPPAAR